MKKKLIASCRVRPYTSGAAIDRQAARCWA